MGWLEPLLSLGVLVTYHCVVPGGTRYSVDQGWHLTPLMSCQMLLKELHMHPTKLTIASSICHALDGVQGNFRSGCMRNCHAQKTEPFGPLFPVGSIVCQRPQLLLHEMDCSQYSTTIFLEYKEYLDFHSGSWIQEPHPVALVISHSSHLYHQE